MWKLVVTKYVEVIDPSLSMRTVFKPFSKIEKNRVENDIVIARVKKNQSK